MTIDVDSGGRAPVLVLKGPLSYPEGTALLREESRRLVDAGAVDAILDLREVPWLDSSGIGEVVACYKRAREKGGVVKLVMGGRNLRHFTYCHLERMFEIFDEPAEALASLGDAGATPA